MTLLTVTAKGQITLRKELLRGLVVGPGDRLTAEFPARWPRGAGEVGGRRFPCVRHAQAGRRSVAEPRGDGAGRALRLGRRAVKTAPDTNVLARALLDDHEDHSRQAKARLADADRIVISVPVLCELVWVLSRAAKVDRGEIARAIQALVEFETVVVDRQAVAAGLRHARAGGGFADGVIGYEARGLGADRFVTFDMRAAKIMSELGEPVELLA